jgi:membrane protein YdbS with pleckstrin-like domain
LIDAIIIAPGLEPVMNPIEKLMRARSSHLKLALAVAALVLVLWAAGSPVLSLWITPVIILVLWIAVQLGLGYHHRHPAA